MNKVHNIGDTEFNNELKSFRHSRDSMERKHALDLAQISGQSKTVSSDCVIFSNKKLSISDLIKNTTNDHEEFMTELNEVFSRYNLTAKQAEAVNDFKSETREKFHCCLDKVSKLALEKNSFNTINLVNRLKGKFPLNAIERSVAYQKPLSFEQVDTVDLAEHPQIISPGR